MSIIDTTTVGADAFGQLMLIDLDPVRQEVKKAIAGFLAGYSGATMIAFPFPVIGRAATRPRRTGPRRISPVPRTTL